MPTRGMGIFRRRTRTTVSELARTLSEQIARPSEQVTRSFQVTAQKMQARAKRDVQSIVKELFFFRAYMMIAAVADTLAGADHDAQARVTEALRADREFWPSYAERAQAYDEALAKCDDDAKQDLVLMAAFQEQLGNPDPDSLLIGLRAWHQFSPKAEELAKFLKRLVITS